MEPGSVLKQSYRIVAPIGRGGMATVYRAESEHGPVAVKALEADPAGRFPPGAAVQFRSECELMAALAHPAIPQVLEWFEEERVHALVMELVEGAPLDRAGRLEEDQVLAIAEALCDVLEYLHGLEPPVIFRDLKPGNVMLSPSGEVKLIDFGIAKLLDEALRRSTQTTARGLLSRGFAAVEQYLGGTDRRSDIYALGATLYTLLVGEAPAESLAVALGKASPPDLRSAAPGLSLPLTLAVESMLRVDRQQRPPDIAAVRAALGLSRKQAGRAHRLVLERPRLGEGAPPRSDDGPPTELWTRDPIDPAHPAS